MRLIERTFEPRRDKYHCQKLIFNSRYRKEDESVADHVAQLRHLSRHCDFEDRSEQRRYSKGTIVGWQYLDTGSDVSIETASKNADIVYGSGLVERRFIRSTRMNGAVIIVAKTTIPTSASTRPKNVFCKNIGHTDTAKMCHKKKEKAKEEKSAGVSSLVIEFFVG